MSPFENPDALEPNTVHLNIKLGKHFNNIFELGYALVDLNSVINTFYWIASEDYQPYSEQSEYPAPRVPTTSRRFSDKHKNELKLTYFHSGSFLGGLATSLATSIILSFVEKWLGLNNPTIGNQTNNTIQINIYDPAMRQKVDAIVNSAFDNNHTLEQNLENILLKMKSEFNEQGIPFSYNRDGIMILARDIQRFSTTIDIYT